MKKGWLIAGAIFGCTAGASLGACSSTSTSGTGNHTTTQGSSSNSSSSTSGTMSSSSGTGGMGGMPTTSSSSSGTGGMPTSSSSSSGTGNCSAVTTLHPPKLDAGPGTIYCPFSAVGDGGNEYCTPTTEHCCETPADAGVPSACQPAATACTAGSTDWGCEDPVVDCKDPTKPVCCAPGASIGLGNPGCGNFAHTMKNTLCVAAGACTGIVMCTSDSECTAPQKCTPFGKAGNQVGGCM